MDTKDSSDEDVDALAAKSAIDTILGPWRDLKDQVQATAKLFRFIASRIQPRARKLLVPSDVAVRFESVCLWLRKILPDLPPEVRDQVQQLLADTQAEQTIGLLHALGDEYADRLRFRQSFSVLSAFVNAFGMFKLALDDKSVELLSEEKLHLAKVALNRLAGMLDYAAIDLDQREEIDDVLFNEHYDASLVDRDRISMLLERIKGQLDAVPNEKTRARLLASFEQLQREVKRPRPRWRSFLGKALILLAIVADIKSVHPEIGDEIIATLDVIIRTVVTGCQVSAHAPGLTSDDSGPKHWAVEPKRIEYKPKRSDDENEYFRKLGH